MSAKRPDEKMGEETREAVAFFLQTLSQVTGVRDQKKLVVFGLLGVVSFVQKEDRPDVVKQMLGTLSRTLKSDGL